MIAADEDALICDLAETYHIYDYRAVPVRLLATLAAGLRPDSRICLSMTGSKISTTETLLAGLFDRVGHLVWMLSEDGQKGRNQPQRVLDMLLDNQPSEDVGLYQSFDSVAGFEAALAAAKGGGMNGN